MSSPWVAKELGILAKYDLAAEILLITGSPRLVQSLIAGDVDSSFCRRHGACPSARPRRSSGCFLARRQIFRVKNCWLAEIDAGLKTLEARRSVFRNTARRRTPSRAQRSGESRLAASLRLCFLQLGGHPQVAAAMVAGKLEAGALGGLAALTAERGGARIVATAADLKILSPSGTFATMRSTIERKRSVVERLMRSFVEAVHYMKTNRTMLVLMQKYMGGLSRRRRPICIKSRSICWNRCRRPTKKPCRRCSTAKPIRR